NERLLPFFAGLAIVAQTGGPLTLLKRANSVKLIKPLHQPIRTYFRGGVCCVFQKSHAHSAAIADLSTDLCETFIQLRGFHSSQSEPGQGYPGPFGPNEGGPM